MILTDEMKNFLEISDQPATAPEVPFTVAPPSVTHKLTLVRARAKNFRAVGNKFIEIDYQRNFSTLVTSDDNGAGKSTMLTWLPIFALFNDTYDKKEKIGGLVNSTNRKDCVVELEFYTKGNFWKVVRGIKPNIFEIYQEIEGAWKKIESDAAKSDYQKYLNDLVGVDQKMVENAIVLGKAKYIPFTQMGLPDRRVMVEAIWDLGFFTVMNEDVKAALKVINTELITLANDSNVLGTKVESAQAVMNQIVESNAAMLTNRQESYDAAVKLLGSYITTLAENEAERDRLNSEKAVNTEKLETIHQELTLKYGTKKNERKEEGEAAVSVVKNDTTQLITQHTAEGEAKVNKAKAALSDKEAERAQFTDSIDKINERLSDAQASYQALAPRITEVVATLKKGGEFKATFEAELNHSRRAMCDFHEMGICPTCTQVVGEEAKNGVSAIYQPKIDEFELKLKSVEERLSEATTQLESYQAEQQRISTEVIAPIQQELADAKAEQRNFEQSLQPFKDDVAREVSAAKNKLLEIEGQTQNKIHDINERTEAECSRLDKDFVVEYSDLTKTLSADIDRLTGLRDAARNRWIASRSNKDQQEVRVADLKAKLEEQPQDVTKQQGIIDEFQAELEANEAQRKEKDELRQDHEHLLYFLKDDQSKARIVSMYLPFLNSKVNEYLEAMNMFLQIGIDDKFDINMLNPDRKGQSVFSLSDGQKCRLNIAIMLALRDVANLKASVQCNVLIMDEVLENMSERGVQEAVMMLHNKFKGNNIFVITQREQEFQEYFQHNIRYGLRNGMTEQISQD